MTDHPETLARYRLPLDRDHLKQAGAIALPLLRRLPKNPVLLIGGALLGVAGVLAWRNRDKIAATAQPLIEDAKTKGQALVDEAKAKSDDLIEAAKATGETIVARAKSVRRGAAAEKAIPDLH